MKARLRLQPNGMHVRTSSSRGTRSLAEPWCLRFSHPPTGMNTNSTGRIRIDGNRTVSWTPSSKEQPEAASALSFRLAGQPLLLVKWKREFCESSYTLFSLGAALKPIASNDYDCDP